MNEDARGLAAKGHLGVFVYCGTNQTKKTTYAVEDAFRDRDATGWGILAIESQAVWNFEKWRHAQSLEEAIDRAWGRWSNGKGEVVAYIPKDEAEVVKLYSAIKCGKRLHAIHDEIRFYMSGRRCPDAVTLAMRTWPHDLTSFRLVTQRIGDIHGNARACHSEIYCFRTVLEADKETLRKEYGVPSDVVEKLYIPEGPADPAGEFIVVRKGVYIPGVVRRGGNNAVVKAPAAEVRPPDRPVPPDGLRAPDAPGAAGGAPVDGELRPEPSGADPGSGKK